MDRTMNFEVNMNSVFNTSSSFYMMEFKTETMSAMSSLIYHIIGEMWEANKKGEHVDRVSTVASVGNSEMDGFIVIAAYNSQETCKAKLVMSYHTGRQSIFMNRDECTDLYNTGIIEEMSLKEERVFLYECEIHFCSIMIHHLELSKYISSEMENILNSLFYDWSVLFQNKKFKDDVNSHWELLTYPFFQKEESFVFSKLMYGENYFSDWDDFNVIYIIDCLYNRFLSLLSSMESSIIMNRYAFERMFGVFGDNGRFLNVSSNVTDVTNRVLSTENFGLSYTICVGEKPLQFQLKIRIALASKPAIVTDTPRRIKDSYMFREWSADERVRLSYFEKRPILSVTFVTQDAIKSNDMTYSSSAEYGFVSTISKFRIKNGRIAQSLKRCINIQYSDAIYLYVEEKLFKMDFDVWERMIKLLDNEKYDESNKKQKSRNRYPYKVDSDELFEFTKISQLFE